MIVKPELSRLSLATEVAATRNTKSPAGDSPPPQPVQRDPTMGSAGGESAKADLVPVVAATSVAGNVAVVRLGAGRGVVVRIPPRAKRTPQTSSGSPGTFMPGMALETAPAAGR
jgi:hypothetical protein